MIALIAFETDFPEALQSVLLCGDFPHPGQKRASLCTVFALRDGALCRVLIDVPWPLRHAGAAPGDHRGVGGCRNHGMLPAWFFRCYVVDVMKRR